MGYRGYSCLDGMCGADDCTACNPHYNPYANVEDEDGNIRDEDEVCEEMELESSEQEARREDAWEERRAARYN